VKRMAAIESTIDRYLKELDRADREQEVTGVPVPAAKVARLAQGIETLKAKLGRLSAIEGQMVASGETQISLTDPDARAMTSQSHSAYTVGYNVQSAVDTEHHLIVAHKVTNVGIDKGHLGSMAGNAREVLGPETIKALADGGHFKSEEIVACEEAGIEVYLPRPLTSNAPAEGRYDRRDFVYDSKSDTYVCPTGERLTYRMTTEEAGKVLRRYWTASVCRR
jgi:transposase